MNIESIINNFDDLKKNWEGVDEDIGWQGQISLTENTISKQRLVEILKLNDYLEFQNSNLLDLGCDNGLYTIILANKFKKLIGMDNSVSSINKFTRLSSNRCNISQAKIQLMSSSENTESNVKSSSLLQILRVK